MSLCVLLGCVLFSVFEIAKTTIGHYCSLVRKAENSFQIENNSKFEVAPKRQSFTIRALVLLYIVFALTSKVFEVEKCFVPFWNGNFTLVKMRYSSIKTEDNWNRYKAKHFIM